MTDRDKVAEAIKRAVCDAPSPLTPYSAIADAAIAAIRPTITTTDELDALPVGAIVKVGNEPGGIFEKDRSNNWGYDSDEDGDLLLAESAANRESVIVLWTPGGEQ